MERVVGTSKAGEEIRAITLKRGEGIEVEILNYGATVQKILVPSRTHGVVDVALGFDSHEQYLTEQHPFFGCIVGRVANRIKDAQFQLAGSTVQVSKNRPPHSLHGGFEGWNCKVWKVEEVRSDPNPSVRLSHHSPDGDEGFPGAVEASVTYTLLGDGELRIEYRATTTKTTPINLTNHSYFNLDGYNRAVVNHILTLNAESYLVSDETVLPTGEIRRVQGSLYDFTSPAKLERDPKWFEGDHGYDTCFVLRDPETPGEPRLAARLTSEASKISLEVFTTQPGVQVYSANFFDGTIRAKAAQLKENHSTDAFYKKQFGVALETQHFPDSPNHPEFPNVFVQPGEEYRHTTAWKFTW